MDGQLGVRMHQVAGCLRKNASIKVVVGFVGGDGSGGRGYELLDESE